MDFWDYLFDNEYRQRADIQSLKEHSHARKLAELRGQRQIEDQQQRIETLENQVGELALLCRSLMTLLRENGTVQPERLQEVMIRIDAEDGLIDGKITPQDPAADQSSAPPQIRTW